MDSGSLVEATTLFISYICLFKQIFIRKYPVQHILVKMESSIITLTLFSRASGSS